MALHQQPSPQTRFVDLPDLPETFADSIRTMTWDGLTVRIEFCVTRYPDSGSSTDTRARRYPVCRMVLTPAAAADLSNRLQQTMAALMRAGIVTQKPVGPAPPPPAPPPEPESIG